MEHISVLKNDVEKYLELVEGDTVVDATLGLGGHALMMVKAVGESGKLIAFEQDGRNLEEAKKRLKEYENRITYIHKNFRYLKNGVTRGAERSRSNKEIDAILFDLGLSSPHVDDPERGFSFLKDGPLDMRFDPRSDLTAEIVVNTYSEAELMRIFYRYGEEKMAKKLARAICERRADSKFSSTVELAEFIESVMPKKRPGKGSKAHPATKIFQAIRIEVNDELNVLKEVLEQALEVLKVGGRIVVISYHSLEDRIVKQFFKVLERPKAEGEQAIYSNYADPIVESLAKKPVVPTDEEIEANPRARSAKLRAYKKVRQP